jgi:sterol desaturase/sphingolipid hydroxylase (fatty acid hydroxylase superfamily)
MGFIVVLAAPVFFWPSNHRVLHAVNTAYVDRNYGSISVVWGRLFGSFKKDDKREPCVYGTRAALNSWDPLWANWQVYGCCPLTM